MYESEIARLLRAYVSEWLETARNSDGSERPLYRKLSATDTAKAAHSAYLIQHPPKVVSDAEGVLRLQFESVAATHLQGEFFANAEATAGKTFCLMMTSNWKAQICKCRHPRCGKYFVISKPRDFYKAGTICRRHQQELSAIASTRERRQQAKILLIELAAKELLRKRITDSRWQQDLKIKDSLAAALIHEIQSRSRLRRLKCRHPTAYWIARHRVEIEEHRRALNTQSGSHRR